MNFVEAMTMTRTFSTGRFKCSSVTPKLIVSEFLQEGYAVAIDKRAARRFCIGCINDFYSKKGLRIIQNQKYLMIQSPRT